MVPAQLCAQHFQGYLVDLVFEARAGQQMQQRVGPSRGERESWNPSFPEKVKLGWPGP